MHPDAARIAHLLRRTGFGPRPGEIDEAGTYDDTLTAILDAAVDDGTEMPDANDDDSDVPVTWWLNRMLAGDSPLIDKLVLFWHSNLASSADKSSADMLVRQHNLFRRHAAGNFRGLIHGIVRDPAMLIFLDGAGSSADSPNENFGRELMELFTLGRGHYAQQDVRAAATALAGFTVDWDSEAVGVDEDAANHSRLTFLGVSDTFDADGIVDVICDQPACAEFVAAKLYRFFIGRAAPDDRLAELAAAFRESDLEILPLVRAILTGSEFAESRLTRPRFPVEWYVASRLALDLDISPDDIWSVDELGQMPFYPPNVGGWPVGRQWVSAGRQLVRASMALDGSWADDFPEIDLGGGTSADRADAALQRCSLYDVAAATRDGLELVARRVGPADGGDRLLTALAMASPEAACC